MTSSSGPPDILNMIVRPGDRTGPYAITGQIAESVAGYIASGGSSQR